jgi:tetratricopeptide (TPR) repeat protein
MFRPIAAVFFFRGIARRLVMKTLACFFAACCLCFASFALNDLGELAKARAGHPAVFVPGNVLDFNLDGKRGYVFNGWAERFFEEDAAESDAELYQEAVLNAKKNLSGFLKKKDGMSLAFQMRGVKKMYEYQDGNLYRVVLFVEKENVVSVDNRAPSGECGPVGGTDAKCVMAEAFSPCQTENVRQSEAENRISMYKEQVEKRPNDCIALSKLAKAYVRNGDFSMASRIYDKIAGIVVSDEKMDKLFASGLLMEAARFEKKHGDRRLALKYYRLIVRCDDMRRWKMREEVEEAKKNILSLSLQLP